MTTTDLDRELDAMAEEELRREARAALAPPATRLAPPSSSSAPLTFRRGASDSAFPVDERNLAVAMHLATMGATLFSGGLFLPLLLPLVAKFALKDRSAALQEHVRQQLNFQLTLAIVAVVGVIGTIFTFGIGALALVPVILFMLGVEIVASVKGAVAASNGEDYDFPFTMDLIKEEAPVRALPR